MPLQQLNLHWLGRTPQRSKAHEPRAYSMQPASSRRVSRRLSSGCMRSMQDSVFLPRRLPNLQGQALESSFPPPATIHKQPNFCARQPAYGSRWHPTTNHAPATTVDVPLSQILATSIATRLHVPRNAQRYWCQNLSTSRAYPYTGDTASDLTRPRRTWMIFSQSLFLFMFLSDFV